MTSPFIHFRQGGFTVFELVMVIVIIGALGMIAVPRLLSVGQFEQRIQADNLVGLLRLAQLRAMNDPNALNAIPAGASQATAVNNNCAIITVAATGISLSKGCASTGIAQLLSSEQLTNARSQGQYLGQLELALTVNSGVSLPFYLTFGQPGAAVVEGGTPILAEASWLGQPYINGEPLTETLVLSASNRQVKIEPEGYIHAD